ncbi:hypothetical protein PR048_010690 [Dryococelus australis]|uniref:Uncharacterized protein n=1 Tax=Dryococelus australis TaxID=614101 RepID=A0ABQ9I4H6_9NEOP|nr:hypothetical protein PR048_010690 [Dryococelus australis]
MEGSSRDSTNCISCLIRTISQKKKRPSISRCCHGQLFELDSDIPRKQCESKQRYKGFRGTFFSAMEIPEKYSHR